MPRSCQTRRVEACLDPGCVDRGAGGFHFSRGQRCSATAYCRYTFNHGLASTSQLKHFQSPNLIHGPTRAEVAGFAAPVGPSTAGELSWKGVRLHVDHHPACHITARWFYAMGFQRQHSRQKRCTAYRREASPGVMRLVFFRNLNPTHMVRFGGLKTRVVMAVQGAHAGRFNAPSAKDRCWALA